MKFRDSAFFPPPGDDDPDRHKRICRASVKRIGTSPVHGKTPGYSENGQPSPRRLSRIPRLESDRSGRIGGDSHICHEDPAMRITPYLLRRRSRSALLKRMDMIRRKIASGYYKTPGHLEELADLLMRRIDFFGPD